MCNLVMELEKKYIYTRIHYIKKYNIYASTVYINMQHVPKYKSIYKSTYIYIYIYCNKKIIKKRYYCVFFVLFLLGTCNTV